MCIHEQTKFDDYINASNVTPEGYETVCNNKMKFWYIACQAPRTQCMIFGLWFIIIMLIL